MANSTRDNSLDATKGIAIFAVVIFHTLRAMVKSGALNDDTTFRFADTVAYGFHIQTFLIIAGYFAYPAANRLQIQLQRQGKLYYGYLFWSLATWISTWLASSLVNHPPTIAELFTIPYVPYLQYWFLMALMMGTFLLAFLRSGTALLTGCAAIALTLPFREHLPPILNLLDTVVFVLIGGWLRACGLRPRANLPAALICAATLLTGAWFAMKAGRLLFAPNDLLYILCGCYAAFSLGTGLARLPWIGPLLCLCGRQSYAIYLAHIFAGAATRIVLNHVAPTLPVGIASVVVIAAAIVGPLIFIELATMTRTTRLFGLDPVRRDPEARPSLAA
jgi:fucose 4-O-acetylase-like acetyltransferase